MATLTSKPNPDGSLFQTHFPPEEFTARRAKIMDAIGPEAVAVLQGTGPVRGFETFRQSNEFYYACGVEVPQCYLLIDGATRKSHLCLPHHDKAHGSEGDILSFEQADLARTLTGVEGVFAPESLSQHLKNATVIYTPLSPAEGRCGCQDVLRWSDARIAADPWDGRPSREQHLAELLRSRLPGAQLRNLSPILDALRMIKSEREIQLLRKAGELSALSVREAMRVTKPGVYEFHLGALAQYLYLLHGAKGEGYRAIIAGGANAWFSHYFRNNCPLKAGDLVLMDVAPDYGYYTSDIGRMWPVSGTYAPWQRELYGFMVEYHKVLLSRIRPGVTAAQVMDEAAATMAAVVERTAFSKPIYAEAAKRTLAFRGHLSHPVGMAVHDVGDYRNFPLAPGMVFTIDPQMWVPEEKLYIRCEDTVAVTETGMENFTRQAPLELDAVEAFLRTEATVLPLMPGETAP